MNYFTWVSRRELPRLTCECVRVRAVSERFGRVTTVYNNDIVYMQRDIPVYYFIGRWSVARARSERVSISLIRLSLRRERRNVYSVQN